MSDDGHPPAPHGSPVSHVSLDGLSPDELRERLIRAMHAIGALQRLSFALKELVPKAFEEGFRSRLPAVEEPWLIDWLYSESRRALDPLLSGMAPGLQGRTPAPEPDGEVS